MSNLNGPKNMVAWACNNYGGIEHLSLKSFPVPNPKDHQLLVKVMATTVDSADVRIRTQKLPKGMAAMGRLAFGIKRPRQPILGTSVVGEVVAVGTKVSRFKVGDRIAAMTGINAGGHAQYSCVNQKSAAKVPESLSDEQAVASLFGGTAALHFLRSAQIKADETILIIGASGAVGSMMVQLAAHFKAHVSAMTSAKNLEWVAALGANEIIDYHATPLDALNRSFDIIADTVAASTFGKAKRKLKEYGRYLAIAGGLPEMLARPSGTKRSIKGVAPESTEIIEQVLKLTDHGIINPVIHDVMDWLELPKAHAIAENAHKRGSLIIRVKH